MFNLDASTTPPGVSSHLHEEALVRACGVVGGQVGGDQQELGVIGQLHVSVSRQT